MAGLAGFGAKTQKKILEGIATARRRSSLFLLPFGLEVGESLRERLAQIDAIDDAIVSGSVRRRLEIVDSVDVVVATGDAVRAIAEVKKRGLLDRLEQDDGPTLRGFGRDEIPVSLHLTAPADCGAALVVTTGSADFVAGLRLHDREERIRAPTSRALPQWTPHQE